MNVIAKQLGYYANIRIKPGQKFRLKSSEDFSKVWMEKLSKKAKIEDLVAEQPEPIESVLIEDAEDDQVNADNNSEVI